MSKTTTAFDTIAQQQYYGHHRHGRHHHLDRSHHLQRHHPVITITFTFTIIIITFITSATPRLLRMSVAAVPFIDTIAKTAIRTTSAYRSPPRCWQTPLSLPLAVPSARRRRRRPFGKHFSPARATAAQPLHSQWKAKVIAVRENARLCLQPAVTVCRFLRHPTPWARSGSTCVAGAKLAFTGIPVTFVDLSFLVSVWHPNVSSSSFYPEKLYSVLGSRENCVAAL